MDGQRTLEVPKSLLKMNQNCNFCESTSLRIVKTTSRARLLAEYKKTFGLSFPSPILESNFAFDSIVTYACRQCGTRTFSPRILGDGPYYDFLATKLPWYYSENRWEYPIALELLNKHRVKQFLEVGCGDGHFLSLARNRGYDRHASEINPNSVQRLKTSGFEVLTDLERDLRGRQYDALIMFQVLEHLLDPFSFLTALLPHVRSQGIIVLSTPVTPSCAASIARDVFKLPPHHQSLPTALGFQRLAKRVGCVCEDIIFDPPDEYQVQFGLKKWFGGLPYFDGHARSLAKLTLRTARALGCDWAAVGHTIMVVFRAPERTVES
jgi:SAM-dependent methyltransferase